MRPRDRIVVSQATPTVRNPDLRSPRFMSRRGWWLLVVNLLIPGSAQALAGDRRLGRFGLGATLFGWALVVLLGIFALVAPPLLITLLTNQVVVGVGIAAVLFYALLWFVLTLDTLRLVRFVRLAPRARGIVATVAIVGLVPGLSGAGFVATRAVGALDLLGIFDGGLVAARSTGATTSCCLEGTPDRIGSGFGPTASPW